MYTVQYMYKSVSCVTLYELQVEGDLLFSDEHFQEEMFCYEFYTLVLSNKLPLSPHYTVYKQLMRQ